MGDVSSSEVWPLRQMSSCPCQTNPGSLGILRQWSLVTLLQLVEGPLQPKASIGAILVEPMIRPMLLRPVRCLHRRTILDQMMACCTADSMHHLLRLCDISVDNKPLAVEHPGSSSKQRLPMTAAKPGIVQPKFVAGPVAAAPQRVDFLDGGLVERISIIFPRQSNSMVPAKLKKIFSGQDDYYRLHQISERESRRE